MDMTLKRDRVEEQSVEKFAMENCMDIIKRNELLGRHKLLFKCKKCIKRFNSFQALGGHMTSHKNREIKLIAMRTNGGDSLSVKPKKHACSICGEEFAIGQALDGHMRKHRDKLNQLEQKKMKTLKENSKSGELVVALHDVADTLTN
ncbi:zinc finger protein ZAT12-like [Solanum dulcamara]|uniref:zinc finger protein ZAT12-like n=1 Tax=Solanum dulcamara TaxID=45834 RepID=UPI00248675E5|nr:zinc finger protein ZAT12-like [Solanum dulcamara]